MQRRVDEAGAAPSGVLDHEGAERPADRAGKAAEQREAGDRPARFAAIEPAERGEHCVIEAAAHAETEHDPRRHIGCEIGREGDAGQPCGIETRARHQYRTAAALVDDAAHLR